VTRHSGLGEFGRRVHQAESSMVKSLRA
jgi:hypothetical protein